MTDLTPGSRWLLPVTVYDVVGVPGDALHHIKASTEWDDFRIYDHDLDNLIPADRITELEAEVERLQAHVNKFEGLYDAARGDLVEAEAKAHHLRPVYAMAGTLMTALRALGYPVSDAHWDNAGEIMSREARDLHLAAVNLRQALDAEGAWQ